MLTGLMIRPYEDHDKDRVIELWHACGLVVSQNNPQRDIERKLKVNPELFLVGVLNGTVIATVMAGYEGHRGVVNYLAVDPEYWHQGIGRLMMEDVEKKLRSLGCVKINLMVRKSNAKVIAFYESIGFRIDDVYCMGKRFVDDSES